jgi:PAS domain S-box-containing protein
MSTHVIDSPVGGNFPDTTPEMSEEQADRPAFKLRASRLIFANSAMQQLSGYSETELVGTSIFELLHSSSREKWWLSVKQLSPDKCNSISVDVLFTTKHEIDLQLNVALQLESEENEYTITGAATNRIQLETDGSTKPISRFRRQ